MFKARGNLGNHSRRIILILLGVAFTLLPVFLPPESAADPTPPGNPTPAQRILEGVRNAHNVIAGRSIPVVTPLLNGITGVLVELAQMLFNAIAQIVEEIMRPVVRGIIEHVFTLLHNPNVASQSNATYAVMGSQQWYDLVGPTVKEGIRNGFDVMKAIAINLLLLLFILCIWRYWFDAHSRHGHGHNLMGALGRLIATTAIILFWPVISAFCIQISNEMIDYAFRTIDQAQLDLAVSSIVDFGLVGGVFGLLGGIAGGALLLVPGPAGILMAAVANFCGTFIYFLFLGVALYMGVSLLVLKAVQTALMLAQFMFAPIFLVFFATPDTEKVAATFIRSCIEVSLWTFVWAGLLRILVVILIARFNPWGQFIMLLGLLQIMLRVPEFMGRAQIGPVSDFLTPRGVVNGVGAIGKTLGSAATKMAEDYKRRGPDSRETSFGDGPSVPPFSGPGSKPPSGAGRPPSKGTGTSGNGGPGSTAPGSELGAAGASSPKNKPPGHHSHGATSLNPAEVFAKDKKDKKISTEPGAGRGIKNLADDKDIVGYGENDSEESKTATDALAGMARMVHHDSAAMAAAERAAGGPDSRYRDNPGLQQKQLKLAARKAAVEGALAYWNGERGNAYTDYLRSRFGVSIPDEMRDNLMEALGDSSLPHSPLNADYEKTKQMVEQAGLPENPATMAAAQQAGLSRLKQGEFAPFYAALAAAAQANAESNGLAGLQPGTRAHAVAMGRAIAGMSSEKKKAAVAVGLGLMGDATAATYSDEETAAWIGAVEELVEKGGSRDALSAMAALRGQHNARASEFGENLPAGPARSAALQSALGHAVAGAMAMKEARIPTEALNNANLAGQVYDLASAVPSGTNGAHGAVAPRTMQALKVAVEARGLDAFTPDDVCDAEALMEHLGYNQNDARNGLVYAQTIRDVQTGGAPRGVPTSDHVAALSTQTRGLPHKDVAQRVADLGYGPVLPAVEVASRAEFDGVSRNLAQVAGRHVMSGAMQSMSYAGNTIAEAREFMEAHSDGLASEVRGMDPVAVGGYIDIARKDALAEYAPGVVYQAVGVAQAMPQVFRGGTASAAIPLQAVIDSGAVTAPIPGEVPGAAGAVVLRMAGCPQMPQTAYERKEIVEAFLPGHFSDGDLGDRAFSETASHVAGFDLSALPGAFSYESAVREVAGYARLGGISPRQIGAAQLVMLQEQVEFGNEPSRDMVQAVVRIQPTGASAGQSGAANTQEINLRVHSDMSSLPPQQFNSVFGMADNLARYQANPQGGQAPGNIEQLVGNRLRGMSREQRTMLVAIAEGGDASLRDESLSDYVARIRTIGEASGTRDPVRALELVRTVTGGAATANNVDRVAETLHFLQEQHVASGYLHRPEMIQAVMKLPEKFREGQFAQATARAVEIYSAAELGDEKEGPRLIGGLHAMGANYGYSVDHISRADASAFEAVRELGFGAAVQPTPRLIGNLRAAQIPINANNATRVRIAALPPILALRDGGEITAACAAAEQYLAAPGAHLYSTADGLAQNPAFVQTLMAIGKIHGAAQCAQVNYVEQTYQDNLQPPQNRSEHTINVQGRQIRVP